MRKLIACLILVSVLNSCGKDGFSPATLGNMRVIQAGINTAVVNNIIVNAGGRTVLARGTVFSPLNSLPSLANSKFTTSKATINNYTDTLRNLSFGTKYYLRSYITSSSDTVYSTVDSFYTLPPLYNMGQKAEGGYVFYMDSTGEHGLVAAPAEYVGNKEWMPWPASLLGGTSFSMFTGASNTKTILSRLTAPQNTAAGYCDQLVVGSYDDWFLGSYEEMMMLRNNLSFQQWLSLPQDMYWTSTEATGGEAFFVVIGGGASFNTYAKTISKSVLPLRRF